MVLNDPNATGNNRIIKAAILVSDDNGKEIYKNVDDYQYISINDNNIFACNTKGKIFSASAPCITVEEL